jgi:hypothetical protein
MAVEAVRASAAFLGPLMAAPALELVKGSD